MRTRRHLTAKIIAPLGIPVRLQLDRENEGVGADLNPAIYRKLAKNN
jgi:hypothetical protein